MAGLPLSRRRLLGGTLAAVGAAAVGAACGDDGPAAGPATEPPRRVVPFHGPHQRGVLQRATAAGVIAAVDVRAADRAEMMAALRALSGEARVVMEGESGPAASVIVGFGASLFDGRYGLAERKPIELEPMPFPAGDNLAPAQAHGDLSVTVSADAADVAQLGLRRLLQATEGAFVPRWTVEGHNTTIPDVVEGGARHRNLLGFRDGTSNLDVDDPATMDRYVWVYPGDDEPAWAGGGTYQAVRVIRMLVDDWDRTDVADQERIIGRHKANGASLGNELETDPIDYLSDPNGEVVPLDAHVRLANPHTPQSADNLILRRGFSYTRDGDGAGPREQGLLFSSFQALLSKGFLAVQARLDGEPLERFTDVVGGGFFFVPPGVTSADGYLGEGLFS